MPGIGRINISYHDPKLNSILASISRKPVARILNEDLNKYAIFTSIKDLKHTNLLLSFVNRKMVKCEYKNTENALADQIIFSTKNKMVKTEASACTSYMLFCEESKVISAVHVSAGHMNDRLFHLDMLLYAYANLRLMAPNDHISAYISGMMDFFGPECVITRNRYMEFNRRLLASATVELISRGVQVKEIKIGYNYDRQEFWLRAGEYKTYLTVPKSDYYTK
jgi:hypothetical protein